LLELNRAAPGFTYAAAIAPAVLPSPPVYANQSAPQELFPVGPALGVLILVILAARLVLRVVEWLAD